jgi:hypothetical protein
MLRLENSAISAMIAITESDERNASMRAFEFVLDDFPCPTGAATSVGAASAPGIQRERYCVRAEEEYGATR